MSRVRRPISAFTPLAVIKENPVSVRVSSRSQDRPKTARVPLAVPRDRLQPQAPTKRPQPRRKSEFDIFDLIKRREDVSAYVMTVRYRTAGVMLERRQKATTISRRRRRRANSQTESEGGESTQTTFTDSIDPDSYFQEDYDFDAEELPTDDPYPHLTRKPGTRAQEMYLRECRRLQVTPSQRFYDNLVLETLDIRRKRLGADGIKACVVALMATTHIHTVDLSDNNLGFTGGKYVAELLKENPLIKSVDLSENGLGRNGVECIVDVLKQSDGAFSLNLSANGLGERDADVVCPIIEATQNLKYLDLSHNQFREIGGQAIAASLLWNDTLETLDLSWNHLRRRGAFKLAQCLGVNSGLKVLKLAWNGFYLPGCKALSSALEKNMTLEELDLTCNRIDRECLEKLMTGLKKNKTLRILRLGLNPLTSAGALLLLNIFKEHPDTGLRELDLADQIVEQPFLELLEEIRLTHAVEVNYGHVKGNENDGEDEDEQALLNEDPVIILIEFGRLMGFRLIDLFSTLDKDGSKSLDHQEIQSGLMMVNIPLSNNSVQVLIQKLDIDKDGEIDLGELKAGQQQYRKHLARYNAAKATNANLLATDVGRVREKLHKLMSKKMSGNPAFKRNVENMKKLLRSGGEAKLKQTVLTRLDTKLVPTADDTKT